MGFEIEVFQRLEAIEKAVRELSGRLTLTVASGPYAGATPTVGRPADSGDLIALRGLLSDLGLYAPGDSLLEQWLVRYTPEQVNAAIRALLSKVPGASAEEQAYNFSVKAHAGGGWKNVFPELAGEDAGPIVNPDNEYDLLAGLSNVNGPSDLDSIVDAVIARAERGITWRGGIARDGGELENAKKALADKSRWLRSWKGWLDESLLRVLVLTNVIPYKWDGSNLFQQYPDCSSYVTKTLAEWLYDEKLAS